MVLSFFRVKKTDPHKQRRYACGINFRERETRTLDRKFCFVHWYEILDEDGLAIDNIDKVLSCIRLRWKQIPEEPHALSTAKDFGHVPLESIRCAARFVPKDECLDIIVDQTVWEDYEKMRSRNVSVWEARQFFTSRNHSAGYDDFTFHWE